MRDLLKEIESEPTVSPEKGGVNVPLRSWDATPRSEISGQNLPIDYFFHHLAADLGSKAVGVILSGTASDGVLGLKAISAEGGITIAQEEGSAKYNGMPHSAIAAGCVDLVLTPKQIAQELGRIAHHPYVMPKPSTEEREIFASGEDSLNKIFLLLRRQTGNDFTYYKPTTIQRRIRRRMLLHKLERLDDYLRYLLGSSAEVDLLFQDVLINVTGFFRDSSAFKALAEKVFSVLRDRSQNGPLRIWVPGCSTGEEAYSIAITLLEYLGEHANNLAIQIFATDIDEIAISKARAGIYADSMIHEISAVRRRRFFAKIEGGGYQISKQVRDMCIFAIQNVSKDPPFSRMDLISCRNLLIYMGPVLQKRIMSIFHYALKPNGYLFLGSAESIGKFSDLYRAIDPKEKIYAKKSGGAPDYLEFGSPTVSLPVNSSELTTLTPPLKEGRFELAREVDQHLMMEYTPAAVVINENMDILQFRGRTGTFIEPSPGDASLNLLKMAREDLILDLNTVIRKAMSSLKPVCKCRIKILRDNEPQWINIEALPIKAEQEAARFFLIVFEDITRFVGVTSLSDGTKTKGDDSTQSRELEQELAATKEYLQSVIEQQESSNEELRSANEEIQSSNEELQSINEELETAKEELQSTNEELATVNDELGHRNVELNQANNDLTNLVSSINIPLVILGRDLRVRRFSPQAETLLNLIRGDIGRPFSDIKTHISVDGLTDIIERVIDSLLPVVIEAQDDEGHWYSIRMLPYQTMDNKIDGVVVVFINVDEMKKHLDEARKAHEYAESIISSLSYPILILDQQLSVISASRAFYHFFRVSREETIGNLLYRLGNGQWGIPELRSKLDQIFESESGFDNYRVQHAFENIGLKTITVSGRHIAPTMNKSAMVLMQIEEVNMPTVLSGESGEDGGL